MTADDPTYDEVIAAAAPVTRPDLDALIRDLRKLAGDYGLHVRGIPTSHEKDWTSTNKLAWDAADALADERARADQADAKVASVEALRDKWMRDGEQPDLWIAINRALSAAPTAEQEADQ